MYILTIEADISAEEIIGLKEQLAEHIGNIRVVEIKEINNG